MKFRFTAEHFKGITAWGQFGEDFVDIMVCQQAADIANTLLEAEEAKCERVGLGPDGEGRFSPLLSFPHTPPYCGTLRRLRCSMNLGDLEFKAEDSDASGRDASVTPCITIDHANRILREKLAKSPEVFGLKTELLGYSSWHTSSNKATHRGRLVCIEKVGKKESSEDGIARCGICGEQMPDGEEMFNYHGHSGPCPTKVGK